MHEWLLVTTCQPCDKLVTCCPMPAGIDSSPSATLRKISGYGKWRDGEWTLMVLLLRRWSSFLYRNRSVMKTWRWWNIALVQSSQTAIMTFDFAAYLHINPTRLPPRLCNKRCMSDSGCSPEYCSVHPAFVRVLWLYSFNFSSPSETIFASTAALPPNYVPITKPPICTE